MKGKIELYNISFLILKVELHFKKQQLRVVIHLIINAFNALDVPDKANRNQDIINHSLTLGAHMSQLDQ